MIYIPAISNKCYYMTNCGEFENYGGLQETTLRNKRKALEEARRNHDHKERLRLYKKKTI